MKVSGFTFIRNAVICDYPIREAILSILPLCDEVVVAVGKSDDETLELVKSIHPTKIRIIETVWDESLRSGGRVFAVETDKAFAAISTDADWAFYIQADEIVHENSHPAILQSMQRWKDTPDVQGLLLDFIHFYGGYNYVADSYKWHRKEVRIIRNDKAISSYKDSMGFRRTNEKLNVKHSGGTIYHYSHVKPPLKMMNKSKAMDRLWHDDKWMAEKYGAELEYDFSNIDSLQEFIGQHPRVMSERISRQDWEFTFDINRSRLSGKNRFKRWVEKRFGFIIGEYRNYRLI